ncbi:unnamed protein product [Calicophoron daubneyi]|uniref:rRNA methyltransferase 2, mitochondrial n=1 Tax=Calicophoron daubneyi TaxID=300641 RepID=A0AAV2TW32_CALDB
MISSLHREKLTFLRNLPSQGLSSTIRIILIDLDRLLLVRTYVWLARLCGQPNASGPLRSARRFLTVTSALTDLASSKRWLARQLADPYVRRSKIESYRCRSAFKLLQLHEQIPGGLLNPGDIVVDCGAAPGSWSQVSASRVNADGRLADKAARVGLVIALDLLDFDPIPGVCRFPRTDLRDTSKCVQLVTESVCAHLPLKPPINCPQAVANVILSDMAPNATGVRDLDIPNIMQLASSVLQLAVRVSAPGATLVVKLWQSVEAEEFKSLVSRFYTGPWDSGSIGKSKDKRTTQHLARIKEHSAAAPVRFMKPPASRTDSSELYLVARGFNLPG